MTWEPEENVRGCEEFARFKARPKEERGRPPKGKVVPKRIKPWATAQDVPRRQAEEELVPERPGKRVMRPPKKLADFVVAAVRSKNVFDILASHSELALQA